MRPNRRQFLQSAALAPIAASLNSVAQAKTTNRPNILLIMADDMGFSDLGCYGSEIETPNLDRLAKNGIRFTQFCNTARCCPSRASLLTGLYSHQAGIGHMVSDDGFPGYRGFLNDQCVTIAEAIRPGGYHPLMVGKWHVGEQHPHWPEDRGFERYFGIITGGDNYFRPERQLAAENESWKPDPKQKFYMTDVFGDHAVSLIDEYAKKSEPFFLYTAFTAPHWPLHAWPADIAKYRGKYKKGWDKLRAERHERQIAMGIVDKNWPLTPRDEGVPAWEDVANQDEWDLRMAVYAAQIDRLDQNIGRMLAKLKETGQEENTLVMFLADNGGCAEEQIKGELPAAPGPAESFTSYRRPWANASNTPFRLYKHWVHEGGIATPFIARWPAVIKQTGTLHHDPAHIIDLMATCLDAAGVSYPKTYQGRKIHSLEGKSLVSTFRGKKRELHDAIYWEHEGNRAVRQGDWKLVSRYPDQWELFNLREDRTELKNLATAEPKRAQEMIGMHEAWAKRSNVLPWDQILARRKQSASRRVNRRDWLV
jgi:arylsulfatase